MSPIDEAKQAERLAAMELAARPVVRRLQSPDSMSIRFAAFRSRRSSSTLPVTSA